MKITILLSKCDATGMTTNALDLCEGLSDLGHEVTLLLGVSNYPSYIEKMRMENFRLLGIKIVTFPFDSKNKGILSRVWAVLHILWLLMTTKGDIIHVESPYLTFCPWLLHKKFTSTFHVCDLQPCFYYKKANHLIAISKETKEYAKKYFGYADSEITTVLHGVSKRFESIASEEEKEKTKVQYHIPTDKLLIGLVGSIERRKGHDVLLKAIRMLSPEDKEKVHVVFCGSSKDGKTNEWLQEEIDKTVGNHSVTHIEYVDSKAIYDILDIFVLPSRLEGFPLVTIEAMLSGVCVVRSDIEGASDQIRTSSSDERNGYIFKNENANQLSEIIHFLINHPEDRKVVAERGRIFAKKNFTARIMAENTVSVYKKIINGH